MKTVRPANSTRRTKVLLLILGALAAIALVWGGFIRRAIEARIILASESPASTDVEEICRAYPDPVPFVKRLWATGKVAHRRLAMERLQAEVQRGNTSDPRIEALLIEASVDADASVRESALSALAGEKSGNLLPAAQAQLRNPDPQVRLLGVEYLSRLDAARALPSLVPLLDDPDLRVVATVEAALRRWTGLDLGVRIAQSFPQKQPDGTFSISPSGLAAIRQGIAKRKAWWEQHRNDYSQTPSDQPSPSTEIESVTVADFSLRNPEGRSRRLSEFRGKVIVLNFWATWCLPCLSEIPDLVELQKRHTNNLVVVGICLDGVPDEHGHVPNVEGNGPEHERGGENAGASPSRRDSSLDSIRSRVTAVIKKKGILYPVLLDPENAVGSRFNGGELPTSVLIDPSGKVRRRFVGARPLSVWEAMIAEIRPP